MPRHFPTAEPGHALILLPDWFNPFSAPVEACFFKFKDADSLAKVLKRLPTTGPFRLWSSDGDIWRRLLQVSVRGAHFWLEGQSETAALHAFASKDKSRHVLAFPHCETPEMPRGLEQPMLVKALAAPHAAMFAAHQRASFMRA